MNDSHYSDCMELDMKSEEEKKYKFDSNKSIKSNEEIILKINQPNQKNTYKFDSNGSQDELVLIGQKSSRSNNIKEKQNLNNIKQDIIDSRNEVITTEVKKIPEEKDDITNNLNRSTENNYKISYNQIQTMLTTNQDQVNYNTHTHNNIKMQIDSNEIQDNNLIYRFHVLENFRVI